MYRARRLLLSLTLALLLIAFLSAGWGCTIQGETNIPVVLMTDYGTDSYWVPQLKGIIYQKFPTAIVIDATHDIPAYDIVTGAFILQVAAREFPEGVLFLIIVAPGDSSKSRFLVLTTAKNQIFLLPDNGLLTYVIGDAEVKSIYQINNESLLGRPVKELFSSQILGKAAGLIASGLHPEEFGPKVTDPMTLDTEEASFINDRLTGAIVNIDNFGNCVTNIPGEMSSRLKLKTGDSILISTADGNISSTFGSRYKDVPLGQEVVFVNRLDFLELAMNMGNFSKSYNLKIGGKVEITVKR
ncbi:S-adenosyl-l-methionine hydroxide adenosyltransferase family protein [Chloroflexota bacterium]